MSADVTHLMPDLVGANRVPGIENQSLSLLRSEGGDADAGD
jgi:hypothetical protein